MSAWWSAYGIGAVSGARSLIGPAILASTTNGSMWPLRGAEADLARSPAAKRLMLALAAGEMLADKSARIPARTSALPLLGRAATGAFSAAACAAEGRRLPSAFAGALGAITGAYALFHLRKLAGERLGAPDALVGLVEDALAITAGLMLVRSAGPRK